VCRHRLEHGARDEVGRAARRVGHDHPDLFGRPLRGPRGGDGRRRGGQRPTPALSTSRRFIGILTRQTSIAGPRGHSSRRQISVQWEQSICRAGRWQHRA
jgi:hypothetical protein